MIKTGFFTNDDIGLFVSNMKIPYYAIKLTKEEAERIKGKMAHIYETNGKQIFDIKDEKGEPTEEKMIYVCWFGKAFD